MEEYSQIGNERLHYLKWGNGHELLIAFHGYNNEAGIFSIFRTYLEKSYTMLSFDLPHHGKSIWAPNVPLTRDDLKGLVTSLLDEYKVDKISLLGYSMGGRVCLTIMEMMPEKISKVLLIAPDGLVPQPLYYFVTKTLIGRKLFKAVLGAPKFFFGITDWLHKKRWTDAARHRFVNYYLGSEKSRKFLFQVLPGLMDIVPQRQKLKAAILKYNIPVFIFMGEHDHIIFPAYGKRFKKGLNSVQLFILEKGHRVFDYDNAGEIAKYLL